MDWIKMIDAARVENANGVSVRAGKRYTTVAVRIEMMRRHLGGTVGVTTEIVRWGEEAGAPIVVKATVADETGRVLATGHAEEIRGRGNVNTTSALENAETSAIGRALASLGLAGGEFASANEMDGVERKAAERAPGPPADQPLPDPSAAKADLLSSISIADLQACWNSLPREMRTQQVVIDAKDQRKTELQKEAA